MTLRSVLSILAIVVGGVYVTTTLSDTATGQGVRQIRPADSPEVDEGDGKSEVQGKGSSLEPSPRDSVLTVDGVVQGALAPPPDSPGSSTNPISPIESIQPGSGRRGVVVGRLGATYNMPIRYTHGAKAQRIVAAYAREKDAKKRSALRGELQKLIGQQFDNRHDQREKEVAQIEKRVRRLRKTLDNRHAARDEIVSHRLDQLIREADGLGWEHAAPNSSATYPSPYRPALPALKPNRSSVPADSARPRPVFVPTTPSRKR